MKGTDREGFRDTFRDTGERARRLGTSHLIAVKRVKNLRSVGPEQAGEDGYFRASVVTWHSLVVRRGCIVQGDIRGWRDVILEEGAVVCGDVAAGGSIFVGRGGYVYGSLKARGDICLREGAVVGGEERTCTVAAGKRLKMHRDSRIYGRVKGEKVILSALQPYPEGATFPCTSGEDYAILRQECRDKRVPQG